MVPQDFAIYPDLTARENLDFFGRLYGIKGRTLKQRINEALERTGLTGRANDRAENFSGGMKRRLNFGVALLHRPRLLILDEPTVGVDPQSRAHLLDCVRTLSAEGVASVYASHYMEEVEALCTRVAIVDRGRVLACDNLQTLLSRLSADLCLRVSRRLTAWPPSWARWDASNKDTTARRRSSCRGARSRKKTGSTKHSREFCNCSTSRTSTCVP